MSSSTSAFDDFVDDCFIGKHPLCKRTKEESQELIASQIIAELLAVKEGDDLISA